MLGILLSLGSAAAFGWNSIVSRRGVLHASPNYIATMSIFSGPVFFLLVCVLDGEISNLWRFTSLTYLLFAAAGIVHFAFGRTFGYKAILLIGVTRAGIVTGLSTVVSVVLAAVLVNEPLTSLTALGVLLSLTGPTLLAMREHSASAGIQATTHPGGKEIDRSSLYRGVLFGLGTAVFWGTSPIFIKLGMENGGTPVAGSLISYVAASLAISYSLFDRERRTELFVADRRAFNLALGSGMTSNIAQLLRFVALAYAPVVTVTLVQRTSPVWVLLMAFFFQRRTESFSRWVLVGNSLLIAGTVMAMF